jgi:hypothetical protein
MFTELELLSPDDAGETRGRGSGCFFDADIGCPTSSIESRMASLMAPSSSKEELVLEDPLLFL